MELEQITSRASIVLGQRVSMQDWNEALLFLYIGLGRGQLEAMRDSIKDAENTFIEVK